MKYISVVGDFDDLVSALSNLPLQDQKDIAEDILNRLYEKGCEMDCLPNCDGTFTLQKKDIL